MYAELLVLRMVHVVCGVLWVGSFFFLNAYLLPSLAASGPAAGTVIAQLRARKVFTVIPVLATLTLLAGLRLLTRNRGHMSADYFASNVGLTYLVSAGLALVAFTIAMLVVRPAFMRSGELGAALAALPADQQAERERLAGELNGLRQRARVWGVNATVMLLLATLGMSVARYL